MKNLGLFLYIVIVIVLMFGGGIFVGSRQSFEAGREAAFAEMRGVAEKMYAARNTKNDVFTACLIEGWKLNEGFRDAWVQNKICKPE